jgi:hypothetical protein
MKALILVFSLFCFSITAFSQTETEYTLNYFPDSSGNILKLTWVGRNEKVSYQITGLSGKIMVQGEAYDGYELIDISKLTPGVYLCIIIAENDEIEIIKLYRK